MTRLELQKIPMYQTATIARAMQSGAGSYLEKCLLRCYAGDYGELSEEDTAANNEELEAGEGHVLARYAPEQGLDGDIYIDIHFSESNPGQDFNYGMIMYCNEW